MESITVVCSVEQNPIHSHNDDSSTSAIFNDNISLWKKRSAIFNDNTSLWKKQTASSSRSRDEDRDVTSVTASDSSLNGDEEGRDLVTAVATKSLVDGGCEQEEA